MIAGGLKSLPFVHRRKWRGRTAGRMTVTELSRMCKLAEGAADLQQTLKHWWWVAASQSEASGPSELLGILMKRQFSGPQPNLPKSEFHKHALSENTFPTSFPYGFRHSVIWWWENAEKSTVLVTLLCIEETQTEIISRISKSIRSTWTGPKRPSSVLKHLEMETQHPWAWASVCLRDNSSFKATSC